MSASSPPSSSFSEWGRRAASLYDADYARRYRSVDDSIHQGALVTTFAEWLGVTCDAFGREIMALDLGCGTGRYFWALRHVRELVGIDVSPEMLAEARHPVDAGQVKVGALTLINADFLAPEFAPGRFDLVYSIGVLGEHVPFDLAVAGRVREWLDESGRFAFTAVHRTSFSIPRTAKRRWAEHACQVLPLRWGGRALRTRLLSGGLYVDEEYLHDTLRRTGFAIESLRAHESDVHRHLLCVARPISRRPERSHAAA